MKRVLHMQGVFFALLLAFGLGMGTAYACDFSEVCLTGQTLYYNIIDANNRYVELTYPGNSTSSPWGGFDKPTGNITLPSSVTHNGVTYTVTKIGTRAFYQCGGLTGSLTIPNSVTEIGTHAFAQCTGFSGTLTLSNSLTSIGDNAFTACYNFTGSLAIPNSVTTIGHAAFYSDGFNGSLTLGSSLTLVDGYAFSGCYFTGSLIIPNSVTTIGNDAFYDSGFAGTLTIGTGVTSIGSLAFRSCGFSQVNYNATNCADVAPTANPFGGCTGTLSIGSNVTRIPAYMFNSCSGFIGSLTIPNSVTTIGEEAFADCGFIGTLTIGTGVTSIGSLAFRNCGFSQVNYNATNCADVTSTTNPFGSCTGTLSIGSNVTRIPAYMFYSCSGFTGSLTIPNSVTEIGTHAFAQCTGFSGTLTLSNSLTSIGDNAFTACYNFTGSLAIPNSVTTIGHAAFYSDGFNGSLTLGSSLTLIDGYAFSGCYFTGSLTIPNSVTTIGKGAFSGCDFTGSLTISNSLTSIAESAFDGCSGFTGSLTIPSSVVTIGDYAFFNCRNFSGSLTIPSSVTTIGNFAFAYCWGLTSMTVYSETPPDLGEDVFYYVSTEIPVYVLCASLEDYQAASGWNAFTNMQCILETLTMYEGTATNLRIPAYIHYFDDFTRSQFVIPADDLAEIAGGTIRSMTFYTADLDVSYTTDSDADVYLMEVDYTKISAFEPKASATIVYSGRFNIESAGDGGEMTINFSTPYTYHGGHLLVGIENTQDNGWKTIYFYGQNVAEASISGSNVSSTGTIPATQQNFIPKTTIGYFSSKCKSQSLPYAYGFEDASELDCWTMLACNINSGITTYTKHTGNHSFQFRWNTNPPQYLISPEFEGTTGVDVSFYYKNRSNSYPETFQVGYSTTTKSPNAFTWGEEVTANDESTWKLYEDFFPEGTKYVAVKLTSNNQYYLYLDDFNFEFPVCPRPRCLTETDITTNSAMLSWTGYQDSYDVRVKMKPYFFEDFENGLPSTWTTIDSDGDGYNWQLGTTYSSSFCHSGHIVMASFSYDEVNDTGLTPDNWLITPQLDLRGTMKVWLRALHPNYTQEHFAIYLSTTGKSVSNFTTVLVPDTTVTGEYACYTADLSAYAGQQGYIAIRHFNCEDQYALLLDDFGLFSPDIYADWVTGFVSGNSKLVYDLTPDTEYEWQVKGNNCNGNGTNTEWSTVHSFRTAASPVFITDGDWNDGSHWDTGTVPPTSYDVVIQANAIVPAGYLAMANEITLEGGSITVADGGQLKHKTMNLEVTMKKNIVGYDDANDIGNYYLLAFPFFSVEIPAAMTANEGSDFYRFDPNESDAEWRNHRNHPIINAYRGDAFLYASPNSLELSLSGNTLSTSYESAMDHTIEYTEGSGNIFNGWELLGNPFTYNAYIYRRNSDNELEPMPIMMYDVEGVLQTIYGGPVAPMQGFFVHVTETTTVCFRGTGHGYVDLGLPSGLLWATCNVGADTPEGYGDYFAWGETQPKDYYDLSTYQYGNSDEDRMTKYCNNPIYGYNGFTDDLTTLLPEDDAATANWGNGWRMPTEAEFEELYNNTTVTWTMQNGVNGSLFTASNGNSLFLPATGFRIYGSIFYPGSEGRYWSSSLCTYDARYAWFFSYINEMAVITRHFGQSVRPVRSSGQN